MLTKYPPQLLTHRAALKKFGVGLAVLMLACFGLDLFAGGWFDTAGGIAASHIAKWNGSSWSAHALAILGSDLYTGGDFRTAGRKVSAYVAKAILYLPFLAIEPDGFGGYFINFSGAPGFADRLQRAPTLKGPWISSAPHTAPANGLLEFWDLFPPPGQGFYRTVQP